MIEAEHDAAARALERFGPRAEHIRPSIEAPARQPF
jgi:hypothetical protein